MILILYSLLPKLSTINVIRCLTMWLELHIYKVFVQEIHLFLFYWNILRNKLWLRETSLYWLITCSCVSGSYGKLGVPQFPNPLLIFLSSREISVFQLGYYDYEPSPLREHHRLNFKFPPVSDRGPLFSKPTRRNIVIGGLKQNTGHDSRLTWVNFSRVPPKL